MIWDRFDDAHDDVRKDIFDNKDQIRRLKAQLDKAGISYNPYEAPEAGNETGPQAWYEDTQREERALKNYEIYLAGLLAGTPE